MQPGRTSRRPFLKAAGAAVLPLPARPPLKPAVPVKITGSRRSPFRSDLFIQGIAPNWMWVRVRTDKGLVGIAESYPGYDAHRGAVKELAPDILGKDATKPAFPSISCREAKCRRRKSTWPMTP
jgi:hypothetical protein